MPIRRLVPGILLALVTFFLLVVTIGPVGQRIAGSEAPLGVLSLDRWFLAETWSGATYEFVGNILMFVPWGVLALIVLGERRWWLAAGLGMALTFTIEVAQIPLERISDPRDLLANTIGVLLGLGAAAILRRRTLRLVARPAQG